MEFKGTKGGLKITQYWTDSEIEIGTDEQPCFALIDRRYFKSEDEAQANAKIIACAPEMLEMLKRAEQWILNCSEEAKIAKDIQEIIKKATE